MRDGVKLYTTVYVPKDAKGPLPIILMRTPYGIDGRAERHFKEYFKDLADDGYIFALSGHPRPVQVGGHVRDDAPAARPEGPEGHRRSVRHARHHRLAAEERAEQQRPRRHARHQLPRLAHGDGAARPAPGAEGRVAAGVAGRHVPRRRLPPQRRVPAQLRLRVRRHDGDGQEQLQLQVRPLRHLRVVSETRRAVERQPEVLQGQDADVERLRRPPELRRLLEEAVARTAADAASPCRRCTSPAGSTRRTSTARSRSTSCSRSTTRRTRTSSSSARGTTAAGQAGPGDKLGKHRRSTATPASTSARRCRPPFFAQLPQGQGRRSRRKPCMFQTGSEQVGELRRAGRRRTPRPRKLYFHPNGKLAFDAAGGGDDRVRRVRLRPGEPGAVSPAAGHADVPRPGVAGVDGGGSAVHARPPRRADLRDRAARRRT